MAKSQTPDEVWEDDLESFMNVAIDTDVKEPEAVETGEYALVIRGIELIAYDSGPCIKESLAIDGEPNAKNITYMLWLPHDGMEDKETARGTWTAEDQKRGANQKAKYWATAHGIPFDSDFALHVRDSIEELLGATVYAQLGQKESEEYGIQNTIMRWTRAA